MIGTDASSPAVLVHSTFIDIDIDPVWMQKRPDGHCRKCQLALALPMKPQEPSGGDDDGRGPERRLFDELDEDADDVLNDVEVRLNGSKRETAASAGDVRL